MSSYGQLVSEYCVVSPAFNSIHSPMNIIEVVAGIVGYMYKDIFLSKGLL